MRGPPSRSATAVGLAACLALVAAGCGGGGSTGTETTGIPTNPNAEAPPKGASQVLREIYRQFPPPQPDPQVKGSAKAIKTGERVCRGKTPLQVKKEFIDKSDLLHDQAKMVAELPKFEKSSATNSSFVAGQLGALVYQMTLPESIASYGYQGCVYSLARRLEKQLAPR